MRHIAIFGGTFDPVHNGHIRTSKAIQESFQFDCYYFVPCKIPTLKPATTGSIEQRLALLNLATQELSNTQIDLREIERDTPSFTVETLKSFKAEQPDTAITLIMGYDAFISLPMWHHWDQLLGLANLLIINREHYSTTPLPEALTTLLKKVEVKDKGSLLKSNAGAIMFFDAGNYAISSTAIREKIKEGIDVAELLPKPVFDWIRKWELYQ